MPTLFSLRACPALLLAVALALLPATPAGARPRWTPAEAAAWAKATPWLVGSNYLPSTAINQLEMWQAETFDPATIDRELAWAEALGWNSLRVFLHDLAWQQDEKGFLSRIEQFLGIAERHRMGVVFVLFDSVWDPSPRLGKQPAPRPGVHNPGWVQSPGAAALEDPAQQPRLEAYVKGIVGHFRADRRVQAWDLWNEPDNTNGSSYGKSEPPNKPALVLPLLAKTFAWARAADPTQPLTSGVWQGDWSAEKLSPIARTQLESSDVISFHAYEPLPGVKKKVQLLARWERPLLCTEYMARPMGSTFATVLPWLKSQRIGAYNWGFVAGKSQTQYPWDSWKRPYAAPPKVWFHDIFRSDGTPYDAKEIAAIKRVTGRR